MNTRLLLILALLSFSLIGKSAVSDPKTIMIVLGSDNPAILSERIEVAYRFEKERSVDKIIVSGGCGAHGSTICEATIMAEGLIKRGVDSKKIYKEENSKTTIQNYVFSRALEDEKGQRIIQPCDTVYVVSNHWHAMSVAARFEKFDDVVAYFHIEGNIKPKTSDMADYGKILNGEEDNAKFVLKGTWPTPQAAWQEKESNYYLFDNIVYKTDAENATFTISNLESLFPDLKNIFLQKAQFIDAGEGWYIKGGSAVYFLNKVSKKLSAAIPFTQFLTNVPAELQSSAFSCGYIIENKLWLFYPDKVIIATKKNKQFVFQQAGSADSFIKGWPYSWGKSNVAAASISPEQRIILYRNMEMMEINKQAEVVQLPNRLKLKWIYN